MDENYQIWKLLQATEPRRSRKYPDIKQLEAELDTAREEKMRARKKRKLEAVANSTGNGEAKKAKMEEKTPEVKNKRKGGRSRKKESEDDDERDEEQEDCSAKPKCLRPIGKEVKFLVTFPKIFLEISNLLGSLGSM